MSEVDCDVVVVGAGLAGLRCAVALRAAGLEVLVLEAADAVGGRIRTDLVDGFRVDRGFQLLNPAYPAVRRWVDVSALGLQGFPAGVVALTDDGTTTLGHPLRAPRLLPATARAGGRRPRELAAVARWARSLLTPRPRRTLTQVLAGGPDDDLATALDRADVDGLLRRVLERFFAGVLLEDDGTTANEFALLLAWMFARGVPSLPHDGMQALPQQLADGLGDRVRLRTPVERLAGTAVTVGGARLTARAIVVATGASEARALTGVEVPATKGVVTTWWAADVAPTRSGLLHVDARPRPDGPLVNCAVVSNPAPSYAPAGRHLVQGSALLGAGRETAEPLLRRHAGTLLGGDPTHWRVVARHEVPHALPAQPAPYSATRPVEVAGAGTGGRVWVCGDHRDTGSIQGALVSGQRAADAVRAALG